MRHSLSAAVLLAALTGCSSSSGAGAPPVAPCDLAHPCGSGLVCVQGACVPLPPVACDAQHPCLGGLVCRGGVCAPPLSIAIASPTGDVATNGVVHLDLLVTNGPPDSIKLYRDGVVMATLAGTSYDWDTTAVPEGWYRVYAVATRGAEIAVSNAVQVRVDRTPPFLLSSAPANGAADVWVSDAVRLTLSEAIRPGTVAGGVTVSANGTPLASTATLAADGYSIDVDFVRPPARPLAVSVSVAPPLADLAGNTIVPATVSFTLPPWQDLGGRLNANTANAAIYGTAVGPDGRPVIAVSEGPAGAQVLTVQRLEGKTWIQLGPQLNTPNANLQGVSLALDATGLPAIAFEEGAPAQTRLERWNGSAWGALGATLGRADMPSLAFDAGGAPVLASIDYAPVAGSTTGATQAQVIVRRWDATAGAWLAVGGPVSADTTRIADRPRLAVDALGRLVLAYDLWGTTGASTVRAARWDPSAGTPAWAPLGTTLNSDPTVSAVNQSLALEADGTPVVALEEGGFAWVRRWDGLAWSAVGGALTPVTGFPSPSIAIGSGRTVVAWSLVNSTQNQCGVSALASGAWTAIGPSFITAGALTYSPVLALDPRAVAVVGYREDTWGLTSSGTMGWNVALYVKRENR